MISKTVTFLDGASVPALGQGTWGMGETRHSYVQEIKALQTGIDLGMTVIDTAEMYADGGAETIVGEAIEGRRDNVFLVSKVLPYNAGGTALVDACERSLKRLKTDRIDLYLLHWAGRIPIEDTISGFEQLKKDGKIVRWGVSNFDAEAMKDLWSLPGGKNCATNQILYHLASRGIEFDLLPWCRENGIPLMGYCPLGQAGRLDRSLIEDPVLQSIAHKHHVLPLQIALAWTLRAGQIIAIPKAVQESHVQQNAASSEIELDELDLAQLDMTFLPPKHHQPLDIV